MIAEEIARAVMASSKVNSRVGARAFVPAEVVYARDEAVRLLRDALELAIGDNGLSNPDWTPWMQRTEATLRKLDRLR